MDHFRHFWKLTVIFLPARRPLLILLPLRPFPVPGAGDVRPLAIRTRARPHCHLCRRRRPLQCARHLLLPYGGGNGEEPRIRLSTSIVKFIENG